MKKIFLVLVFIFLSILQNSFSEIKEIDLALYEKSYFSQNGEDGIIETFFSLINPGSFFCVEFDAENGYWLSNTLNLRDNYEWKCLLLDAQHENNRINLYKEFITAENINHIFDKYNVPYNLDLLSIDMDYNDFYVWHALDEKYKPALVVIEYNCSHGAFDDKIVVYNPLAQWDHTNYYGASMKALYLLGKKKGYSLIYVEQSGCNCFFARNDILDKLKERGISFSNVNDLKKLCTRTTPQHSKDPLNRPFVSSEEILK